ncbi:MAG TPA: AAA family ATPase [Hanamia sp.]|nr:AAA family ATPase [Hanamia sp.]
MTDTKKAPRPKDANEVKRQGKYNNFKRKVTPFKLKDFTGENDLKLLDQPVSNEGNSVKTFDDFEQYRITKEKHVEDPPATITIGGSRVAAPGNTTPITAEGKGGKTAFTCVCIAGAISTTGDIDGFKGLFVKPNPEGKAVIHLDTEQSEADQQFNLKTILKRAAIESTPDYYHSYNIRTIPLKKYEGFVNSICELCNQRYNGIHLIVVDGAADFITSVNDEAEANAIIFYFTTIAVKYNCPVLLVIHLNENAGKNNDTMPRGHVGRQAVRKGYCQLNITKESDVSTLQVLRARKAGCNDAPLICYQYSKEKGYHISVDPETIATEKQTEKDQANFRKIENLANEIFRAPNAWNHKESISKIMKQTSKTESTAKRYLNNMLGWDMICKNDDGFYRIIMKGS